MLYIVTVATHTERYFEILKESCPDIIVLGYGTKWNGWIDKAIKVTEFCKTTNPDDIICYVDGFDSVILEKEEIEKRYLAIDKPLIFSMECSDDFPFCRYFQDKVKWRCESTKIPINAGLYIGRSETICSFWSDFIKNPGDYDSDDQTYAVSKCEEVEIDTEHKLFLNYYPALHSTYVDVREDKVFYNDSMIPILSAPAWGNMNSVLEKLGYSDLPTITGKPIELAKFTMEFVVIICSLLLFFVIDKKYAFALSALFLTEMVNYEVRTKYMKTNRILYSIADMVYLVLMALVPWIILEKNVFIGNALFLILLILPFVTIDTRIRYIFEERASYDVSKGNMILITFIILLNLYRFKIV